mmetsp:Transcript_1593/g.3709  ORF Transcript_1593/g.3709 Transcript_1593/m.3709 type:complete len:105 (+) Transcript_1593:3824-4138(+)
MESEEVSEAIGVSPNRDPASNSSASKDCVAAMLPWDEASTVDEDSALMAETIFPSSLPVLLQLHLKFPSAAQEPSLRPYYQPQPQPLQQDDLSQGSSPAILFRF